MSVQLLIRSAPLRDRLDAFRDAGGRVLVANVSADGALGSPRDLHD